MKLILFILLLTSTIYAQTTYTCTKRFFGTIDSTFTITWVEDQNITTNNQLTITKDTIYIENNKYYYVLNDTIEQTSLNIAIYTKDHLGSRCIVLIEEFFKFKFIYFQYKETIFGYCIKLTN